MHFSPLTQKRWQRFKSNKRGFWSLWIFLILFALTGVAELWVNDKPLLIRYNDQWFTPITTHYLESDFFGDFELSADYRDPVFIETIEENGWMLWPIVRFHYSTINYNTPTPAPSAPTGDNWLGTDDQARDVFARVVYGFRISVLFGLILTILSSVIGIAVGAVQGYFGGRVDLIGQRFLEIWSGLPTLFILIILSSLITPSFFTLLGIMLLFGWMGLVDMVRAEFLRGRNLEYVKAARAMGAPSTTIMFKHILPNAMVATVTFMPFLLTGAITSLTALDFLGFGLPPGSPSLGELVQQGKNNLHAPWLALSAFVSLATLLTLLVFIGEAARDAFDPRVVTV